MRYFPLNISDNTILPNFPGLEYAQQKGKTSNGPTYKKKIIIITMKLQPRERAFMQALYDILHLPMLALLPALEDVQYHRSGTLTEVDN